MWSCLDFKPGGKASSQVGQSGARTGHSAFFVSFFVTIITSTHHTTNTMKQAAALLALATTAAANHDYTVSDLISGNFTVTTNDITMGT